MSSPANGITNGERHGRPKVVIIGCGLGGLACAISSRREGLHVVVLEKSPELSEVGAGIQLPPNASRIMSNFGLMGKLHEAGSNEKDGTHYLRWEDGTRIGTQPGIRWTEAKFGHAWHTMHRADYQRVLFDEARRLGAEIRLGCDVVKVECNHEAPVVHLLNGETIGGNVVIGADGLRSVVRNFVLGYVKEPEESGDLAYRITIPKELLVGEKDSLIQGVTTGKVNTVWWGQNSHAVMYSLRGDQLINIVLVCPDDLPAEVSKQPGDLEQMKKFFETWDPRLQILINRVDRAFKWKIWGMEELDQWTKESVALLGDACHPSVPYAASGAAMAVEDGVVLGRLLGHFDRAECPRSSMPELLKLYQDIRKQRAMTVVKTADGNREQFHMIDGKAQQERDRLLRDHDWWDENRPFPWIFADLGYLHELLGFDTLKSADDGFASSRLASYTQTV